ncbi:NACHT domain-containing protein [Streptosporangium canum]|uniref:NACHT domain-containing protein n=1 Tax=Streptosporangium canum TaxID=324952 RepID=UPI00341FF1D8
MRNLWRRSRTSTRLGLVSIGLTILLSGSIYLIVAAGGPDWLTTVANISQIIGLPLAVVSIVVPSVAARRSTVPEPVRVALARQVHQQECQVRAALLRGVIAADLSFDDTDPAAAGYSADRGRDGDGDGDGREPEGGAVARWVSKKAAGLLFWQETDPLPPRDGAGGPPAEQGTPAGVAGYFSTLPDQRLIIVGERGSGKTMLVIQLVIDLNQAILDDPAAGGPVAIRLSAASWPTGRPPADWLADQLVLGYALSPQEARRLVAENAVLPILDGLDEMDPDPIQADGGDPAPGTDPAPGDQDDAPDRRDAAPVRAAALIDELNRFYAGAVFGPVVVTTRPDRHTQLIERGLLLEHARQITIRPLTVPQITDYLHRRYRYQPRRHHAWQAVLDRLDHSGYAGVREFLSTPWRLILATSAIDHDPGQAAQLVPHSDRHSTETETAAQTRRRLEGGMLADFIPAATALTPRGRGSYTPEQVERWLTALARHLRWQADYLRHHPAPSGMSEVDIVPHLLWPIGGRRLTRLLHTTALLIGIVVVAALVLTPFPPAPWPGETPRWVLGAVLGVTFLPLLDRAEWPAPHVAMRNISAPALQAGLGGGLLSGLMIVGLAAIGSVFGTVKSELVVMAVFGLVGGPLGGLVFGLMGGRGSWNPSADLVSPRQAVHRDLMFGLASGLVLGIMGGVVGGPFGFIFGLAFVMLASFASTQGFIPQGESEKEDRLSVVITIAVGFGLMVALGAVVDPPMGIRADLEVGLWSGLVGGLVLAFMGGLTVGSSGAYYAIGIMLAALRGRLPWRFTAFCQWACQAGLLRVAGTGYQFRHHELQSWLTDHR